MKAITSFINEKLKLTSTHNIPNINEFINAFDKYIWKSESLEFHFSMLDSIGKIQATNPNSIVKLPEYKIIGNESFLDLPDNKFFKYPQDTIYLYYIDLYLDGNKHLFSIHYIPKEGLNYDNLKTRRHFDVYPEDLINILGEDIYIETYNYLEHYEKN